MPLVARICLGKYRVVFSETQIERRENSSISLSLSLDFRFLCLYFPFVGGGFGVYKKIFVCSLLIS